MKYAILALLGALALTGSFAGSHVGAGRATIAPTVRSSAQVYSQYCVSCHGRNGAAQTRRGKTNHARNLKDAEWQARVSDERIFNSIMNGKGKMPGYSKKLSEQEIDALVSYVRSLKG